MILIAAHDAGSASHLFRLDFEIKVRYFSSGPANEVASALGKKTDSIDSLLKLLDQPDSSWQIIVGTGATDVEKEVMSRALKGGLTTIAFFDSVTNLRERLIYNSAALLPNVGWTQDREIIQRLAEELPSLRTKLTPNPMLGELLSLRQTRSSSVGSKHVVLIGDPLFTEVISRGDNAVLQSELGAFLRNHHKVSYRPHPIEPKHNIQIVTKFLTKAVPKFDLVVGGNPLSNLASASSVVGNSSYLLRLSQLADIPVLAVSLNRVPAASFGEDYSNSIVNLSVPSNQNRGTSHHQNSL